MPTDTQERIKDLLNVLSERGTGLVGEDGKMISQTVKELEQEVEKLKNENTGLRQDVEDLKVKDNSEEANSQISSNPNSVDTEELVQELRKAFKRIDDLEEKIKNIGTVETEIDLKKEFKVTDINNVNLKADDKKPAVNAETLNKVLKKAFMPDPKNTNRDGYELYPFGARTLNDEYTPKQWITGETAKIQAKDKNGKGVGAVYDNRFDTANPAEKKVMLGTGAGKSTFFLRCTAHGGAENKGTGASLIVPYSSLIGSVLGAHNYWLSAGKDTTLDEDGNIVPDPEKRVTVCPICDGWHTARFNENGTPVTDPQTKKQVGKYETVHNAPSSMINVFTWWEFLDAFVNDKKDENGDPWIKPWVIYDEAHTDLPNYRVIIDVLKEKPKMRNFKMIEMSATFNDIATSRNLTGTITDYLVTDFGTLLTKYPKIFEKKVIMFVDKPERDKDKKLLSWDKFDKIDLKALQAKTKVLILNEAIKDYATDIVLSMEAPLIVIASRDYSVGFSFGDVNVISTGIAKRTIRVGETGKWTKDEVTGVSAFDDLLQERGRAARNKTITSAVWMSLVPSNKSGKYNLVEKDSSAQALQAELKKGKIEQSLKDLTAKLVEHYSKPEPVPPIDPVDGHTFLVLILTKDLESKLCLPGSKLFNPKTGEVGKDGKSPRQSGEYTFFSSLMRFFKIEELNDILILAVRDKIKNHTDDVDKDTGYIYEDKNNADIVRFLANIIFNKKYTAELIDVKKKNSEELLDYKKLAIQFQPFGKIKKGQDITRALPVSQPVSHVYEEDELEAKFEVPPRGSDGVPW